MIKLTNSKILIAIDEPEMAKTIVKTACKLINKHYSEITLLNVMETTLPEEELFVREPQKFIQHESLKSSFAEIENYLEENEYNYKGMIVLGGVAAKKILKLGDDYDLVVIGSNEKNVLEKILLGSTSYKVIRDSKFSVLVIKPHPNEILEDYKVLFASDGSDYSEYAADYIGGTLDREHAKMSIINVRVPFSTVLPIESYSYIDMSSLIAEAEMVSKNIVKQTAVNLIRNGFNIDEKLYLEGDPATEILNASKEGNYNLIIIGSHGKNKLSKFLMGSTSTKVYENSHQAVLIVKKRN